MKLKNYRPRPMRQVEYGGVSISIPADHEWVAMDANGEIYSYSNMPEYNEDIKVWGGNSFESTCLFRGSAEPSSRNDARNSLRNYPIGEQA